MYTIVLKSVQLYTPVATCATFLAKMSLKMIEKNVCVYGGGIIMHFFCGRSQTRLKNSSEIWNLDLKLNLDLAEIWISIASNKMLI